MSEGCSASWAGGCSVCACFCLVLVAGMKLACQNKSTAVIHGPEELILVLVTLQFCKHQCNNHRIIEYP